jgi:hypothetical protein
MSPLQQTEAIAPNGEERGEILSSCGRRIHVIVAGIVNCHFRLGGDRDATFTLIDHTHGLILISPTTGNRTTKFTITGVLVGSGYFIVRSDNDRRLRVRVRVTL